MVLKLCRLSAYCLIVGAEVDILTEDSIADGEDSGEGRRTDVDRWALYLGGRMSLMVHNVLFRNIAIVLLC